MITSKTFKGFTSIAVIAVTVWMFTSFVTPKPVLAAACSGYRYSVNCTTGCVLSSPNKCAQNNGGQYFNLNCNMGVLAIYQNGQKVTSTSAGTITTCFYPTICSSTCS